MEIVLMEKWKSHLHGDTINVTEHLGERLIRQGTARPFDEIRDGKKQIDKAPRDKMVRGATINK